MRPASRIDRNLGFIAHTPDLHIEGTIEKSLGILAGEFRAPYHVPAVYDEFKMQLDHAVLLVFVLVVARVVARIVALSIVAAIGSRLALA